MVATNVPVSSMPSRRTVEKPLSVKVTDVGAGTQIDDPVLAAAVGDDRANLLDQRRARRLDRDTRQHRAGGVPDDAGDRRLRVRQHGHQDHEPEHEHNHT